MLNTNKDNVVEFLLQCQPGYPRAKSDWSLDHDGNPFILPSIGGITLNVQIGDSVFGLAGDHIEPGVSCTCDTKNYREHPNSALQFYACAGNRARVISGEAKGAIGYVIGKHGGSEHVIVDFPYDDKLKMTYDDKIIIYAKGMGLKLTDYPEIMLYNIDPLLLEKMNVEEDGQKIKVPVTTLVPAQCMGSGIGASHTAGGDYDIMTSDSETVKEYGLDKIRFGDFVALIDHDNRYGRSYRKGSVTIGVVCHSDCLRAGHGPGVTAVMTCKSSLIEPVIDPKANMADIIGIGTTIK